MYIINPGAVVFFLHNARMSSPSSQAFFITRGINFPSPRPWLSNLLSWESSCEHTGRTFFFGGGSLQTLSRAFLCWITHSTLSKPSSSNASLQPHFLLPVLQHLFPFTCSLSVCSQGMQVSVNGKVKLLGPQGVIMSPAHFIFWWCSYSLINIIHVGFLSPFYSSDSFAESAFLLSTDFAFLFSFSPSPPAPELPCHLSSLDSFP